MSEHRTPSPFAQAPAGRRRVSAKVPPCHCAGRCHCGGLVPALLLRNLEMECEFFRTVL
jgi:hypothetical protein